MNPQKKQNSRMERIISYRGSQIDITYTADESLPNYQSENLQSYNFSILHPLLLDLSMPRHPIG